MTEQRILIVEDEPKIASLLGDYLAQSGFVSDWLDAGDGAVNWIRDNQPDLVLLDLMLPGKDGQSICREVRTFSGVPIIMLTARVEEIDRLVGLELGADDYICKPFSPREVIARVKAVLRRAQHLVDTPGQGYRGLAILDEEYRATLNGEALDLTPVEFRVLAAMVQYPGRVFSRDQLMDKAYADGRIVSDRTMDSHIKNLRRKLNVILPDIELIQSVYGIGYRLE